MNGENAAHIRDEDAPLPAGHVSRPPAPVSRVIQSARRTGAFAAGDQRGMMRASDADRDRVAELLNVAYSEGRLSRDEYDARLQSALSARTYADLDQLVADLPAARPATVTPVARTNALATASLACGIAQFAFGLLATIPAIVLGHMARSQIKRTGEQGAGLALVGLTLGWAALILVAILVVVLLVVAGGVHGTISVH
jgi:Domain of unknown function (DUF1707)/Domain of unknown function (DUF4190)